MKSVDTRARWLCRSAMAAAVLALCLPGAWARGQHSAPRQAPRQAARPAQHPGPRPGYAAQRPQNGRVQQAGPLNDRRNASQYSGYNGSAMGSPAQRQTPMPQPNSGGPGAQGMQYRGQGYARPGNSGNAAPGYSPPGHLGSWLNQHRGVPVQQQEQMLRSDPSFNRLPQATQQRLVQQLHQVDQMPAAQRDRRLARAENLERMSPQQRSQVSNAARRWNTLPADRQAMMGNAFRDLRGVPPDQRQTVLNSDRYQHAFSPEERGILSNMLSVEPYEPPK